MVWSARLSRFKVRIESSVFWAQFAKILCLHLLFNHDPICHFYVPNYRLPAVLYISSRSPFACMSVEKAEFLKNVIGLMYICMMPSIPLPVKHLSVYCVVYWSSAAVRLPTWSVTFMFAHFTFFRVRLHSLYISTCLNILSNTCRDKSNLTWVLLISFIGTPNMIDCTSQVQLHNTQVQ